MLLVDVYVYEATNFSIFCRDWMEEGNLTVMPVFRFEMHQPANSLPFSLWKIFLPQILRSSLSETIFWVPSVAGTSTSNPSLKTAQSFHRLVTFYIFPGSLNALDSLFLVGLPPNRLFFWGISESASSANRDTRPACVTLSALNLFSNGNYALKGIMTVIWCLWKYMYCSHMSARC